MIVTVTLNAALDRSLTVPIFKLGHRHRASNVLVLAGGKGINVARALKRLDVPVVATGLAGGRNGPRIVEELTEEAILNDFVRIRDESRTSTAVVDPTSGTFTEINEWGPKVSPSELEMLLEKLRYLARGASTVVVRRLPAPRGRRASTPKQCATCPARRPRVLDTEGEPLRRGLEAEPFLVSPNQHEAEQLVGQELVEEDDFLLALDDRRARARATLNHPGDGCFALAARGAPAAPATARCAALEAVSPVGAGDALLAGFIAARLEAGRPPRSRCGARSRGTASTLEVGAGPLRPRRGEPASPRVELHDARARLAVG